MIGKKGKQVYKTLKISAFCFVTYDLIDFEIFDCLRDGIFLKTFLAIKSKNL